jgi:adenylate cyclase
MRDNRPMPFAFDWLYRRLDASYFWLFIVFEVGSAFTVCLSTVGLFSLYQDMSTTQFLRVLAVSEACVAVALAYSVFKSKQVARPLLEWVREGRPPERAVEVWRDAVALPRDFVVRNGWQPFAMVGVPVSIYFTVEFDLPFYSAAVVFAAALVAVAYAAMLHFFASEAFLRPVLGDIARLLPADFSGQSVGVPLRWKLLGALPLINVITGVVVSGLSVTDQASSVSDLGVDVVVAVVVAFTISLELTLLVTRSVLRPVDDLLAATERVKRGDLDARVPLLSGDELGTLAGSFNEMMRGLAERERLREALGSYVDPDVANRVLTEGALLEGQDVEATVMFVDIRDFTPLAERSSARETVAYLNEFFELVVPIVLRHGGHANKFIGDGVLACFGAPEPLDGHAVRGVSAAIDVVLAVEERFGGRLSVGVGLNSGPLVVGSVGGGGRLEFTVIGDPVNVAARVEAATRETGDPVLITEATRCLLDAAEPKLLERGEVPLKGKSEPTPIYALAALDGRSSAVGSRLTAGA